MAGTGNQVRRGKLGFTTLEVTMSLVIASIIVMASIALIQTSGDSAVEIWRDAKAQSAMRSAIRRLKTDFRQTAKSRLTITAPGGTNHSIKLQRPLAIENSTPGTVWGVYARELGSSRETRQKQGWFVRYRVQHVTKNNKLNRQFVREYLDPSGNVRHSVPLVHFLEAGNAPKPGFHIEPSGAMWKITLTSRVSTRNSVRSLDFRLSVKN